MERRRTPDRLPGNKWIGHRRKPSIWVMNASTGARRVLVPADKLKLLPGADNAEHQMRLTYSLVPGGDRLVLAADTSLTLST